MDRKAPRVSVVLPCYNEAEAIASVLDEVRVFLMDVDPEGEILVVDNGSQDQSAAIARRMGADVIIEVQRGYGNACRKGLACAQGQYVVLADADGTYRIDEARSLLDALENGYGFATGSRLKGKIVPGAMPALHRFVGVPLLTWVLNRVCGTSLSDAHCGLRAIRRDALSTLHLSSEGMEFASEMIIAVARRDIPIAEHPISYLLRKGHSKLRTMRDGLRHLWLILRSAVSARQESESTRPSE